MTDETNFGLYTQAQVDEAVQEAIDNRGGAVVVTVAVVAILALLVGFIIGLITG